MADAETKLFASAAAWEKWLSANHARSKGVWLKIAKAAGGARSVSYAEALEIALAFGWIDARKAGGDERFWLQRFTPRAARSKWSQVNRAKATLLIESGRMRPAGLGAVEKAKADGRWDAAYASPSRATVPADFARALAARPRARAFFDELDAANRYAILYRLHDAKRPETRAARVAKFVEMLANGETLHPRRGSRTRAERDGAPPAERDGGAPGAERVPRSPITSRSESARSPRRSSAPSGPARSRRRAPR